MPDVLSPYSSSLLAFAVLGGLFIVQILVADFSAVRTGHTPGTPVSGGHDDFVFRAARAHANTNESLAAFILIAVTTVLGGGDANWVNPLCWTFVVSRAVHMLAYYADVRLLRSAAFVASLVCLIALLVTAIGALVA